MIEILRTSNLIVRVDPDSQFLHLDWIGYQTAEEIKDCLELVLTLLKERDIARIINDNRRTKGTWTSVTDWVSENWMPRAIEAGLIKVLFVENTDILNKFSLDQLTVKLGDFSSLRVKDIELGKEWLLL